MPKNHPHPNEPKVRHAPAPRKPAPDEAKVDARDVADAVKRDRLAGLASLRTALKADADKREVQRVAAVRAEREAVAEADEFPAAQSAKSSR